MTPKEKARELLNMFAKNLWETHPQLKELVAKQCALICVDEVIEVLPKRTFLNHEMAWDENPNFTFWNEVKAELEKP
jgi:hypothetical protein